MRIFNNLYRHGYHRFYVFPRHHHSVANHSLKPVLSVQPVPLFEDNYAYLVVDEANHVCAAIDPADPKVFVNQALASSESPELVALLCTHHHWDHASGNQEMAKRYPGLNVYGPANESIPAITSKVGDGDTFNIGGLDVKVFGTPCHTKGHIMYFVDGDENANPVLFSGDTLFIGGCGRFMEGNATQMFNNLYSVVAQLPLNTHIYCGHEYTLANYKFGATIDTKNTALQEAYNDWKTTKTANPNAQSIPSTIQQELDCNIFMQVHRPHIAHTLGISVNSTTNKNSDELTQLDARQFWQRIVNIVQNDSNQKTVEKYTCMVGEAAESVIGFNPIDVLAALRTTKDNA